jgi:hypothetical protein
VIQPLYTPAYTVSITPGTVGYATSTPLLPVNASLNYTVVNGDPVSHGFLFVATVENVSVKENNTTTYLPADALASWAAGSEWVFHLPDGTSVDLQGGSVSLPSGEYVSVPGVGSGNSAPLVLDFANPGTALAVQIQDTATELCAPSGSGTASATFTVVPP